MTDASFVKEIVKGAVPFILERPGDEVTYSDKNFSPVFTPTADPIVVHTLSAIVDYCELELDPSVPHVVHVVDPTRVEIISRLTDGLKQRDKLVVAKCIYVPFIFDSYHNIEQFNIALQAQFVQDDVTAKLLNLVGNITVDAKQQTVDDGVTQVVKTKTGIVGTKSREVPNPVTLKPFRTFAEVQQPASKFVFRLNASVPPGCALYEADGGAWKNEAVQAISGYLAGACEKLITDKSITVLA